MGRLDEGKGPAAALSENAARDVTFLLVTASGKNCGPLKQTASECGWRLLESTNCAEALKRLGRDPVPVVVCEQQMPDGDWKYLLRQVGKLSYPPNLIVASRRADDRLWAEALNLGAYDLLMMPFEPAAARRVISLAFESKRREWGKNTASPQKRAPSRHCGLFAGQPFTAGRGTLFHASGAAAFRRPPVGDSSRTPGDSR